MLPVALVVLLLSGASDCDETDVFGSVAVPDQDSTAPTAGLVLYAGDGVEYTAPYVGVLVPRPGDWNVIASAEDYESGIRAIEILTTTTTTTCPSGQKCTTVSVASAPLPGSYEHPREQSGEQVLRSGLAGTTISDDDFVPEDPPDGTRVTVKLDLFARATNHLDGRGLSPLVSLSYTAGEQTAPTPACRSFTLGWSWTNTSSSDGEFSDAPSCPAGTGAQVKSVGIRLQFPPGTWDQQVVTVSHHEVEDAIKNQGKSSAFNGMDPAGEWTVIWGGNVQIHPIGIQLEVLTE